MSFGEGDLVMFFNGAIEGASRCSCDSKDKGEYLSRAGGIAFQIESLDGGLSASAALELEEGSIKALNNVIKRAFSYERCTPGSSAQKGYLDTADRITGILRYIDGKFSEHAVSKMEEGLVKAFDYVVQRAYIGVYVQGGAAQNDYLAAADDITGRIISLEGSLSETAVSGLQNSLLKAYNRVIKKAYIDHGYEGGSAQKDCLDAADQIVDRIISIAGGLSETAVFEIKNCLESITDYILNKADVHCVPDSVAEKIYIAIADEIEGKMTALQPTIIQPALPVSGNRAAKEPPALADEVLQAIAVLNTPRALGSRQGVSW